MEIVYEPASFLFGEGPMASLKKGECADISRLGQLDHISCVDTQPGGGTDVRTTTGLMTNHPITNFNLYLKILGEKFDMITGPKNYTRLAMLSHFKDLTMPLEDTKEIIHKKIRDLEARRRLLVSINVAEESKIAKLQEKTNEILNSIKKVRLDFQSLAANLWFLPITFFPVLLFYKEFSCPSSSDMKKSNFLAVQCFDLRLKVADMLYQFRSSGNTNVEKDRPPTVDNPNEREFLKQVCWIPQTPPKLISGLRKILKETGKSNICHVDDSTRALICSTSAGINVPSAPCNGKLKKRGYDGIDLELKPLKRVRRKMEDKSKIVPCQKFNNFMCSQLPARSCKKVPHDSALIWHSLPQVDVRKDEAESNRDKEKWWEEERELFDQRVKSFIACMNTVQGNKYSGLWRGSVVDSVVGAVLTQNVKDTASSAAFMSLAAKYPSSQMQQAYDQGILQRNESTMKAATLRGNGMHVRNYIEENDFDILSSIYYLRGTKGNRSNDRMDSLDWEAVRQASFTDVSKCIIGRGMNNKLAERIQDFLDIVKRDHGSIDLEWLRDAPPEIVKKYLLSIGGIGLKCIECVRLLALEQHAFPVDTNVARIVVRLGWIPLRPSLHWQLQHHHVKRFPDKDAIHKYLWPRLSTLDRRTLYELHCQMITCGKVFCTNNQPNCNACPMKAQCKHFESARSEGDMEDFFGKAHDIQVDAKESVQSLQNCLGGTNVSLQEGTMSNSSAPVASNSKTKLKHLVKFRTVHQVYELPDFHCILKGLERRELDDPSPYLLAVWTPGEVPNSNGRSECQFDKTTRSLCNNGGQHTNQNVLGTILIPCRTATRGTFPLSGTYFQANEVLADHETSNNPIEVPLEWIQHLKRRTLYCGNSVLGIFRGLLTEEIRHCFKEGYVCLRGFNKKTRESKPLVKRFHHQRSKGDKNLT